MRDPSSAAAAAEEQTLKQTPDAGAIDNVQTENLSFETAEGSDPEAVAEDEMSLAEEQQSESVSELTKDSLLTVVREMSERTAADISGDELRRLRKHYNTIRKNETDSERAAWVENGNEPDTFVENDDPTGAEILSLLDAIRERKAAYAAEFDIFDAYGRKRGLDPIEQTVGLDILLAVNNHYFFDSHQEGQHADFILGAPAEFV